MALELLLATVMVLLTVGVHAAGLALMAELLNIREHRIRSPRQNALSLGAVLVTVAIILGLFVLHGLEIWLYAFLFRLLGAVENLREAVYFSTISYGAIGYGDSSISPEWKLLGAIEGINGVILLGWSVAFFVTVMTGLFPAARHHGDKRRDG